jgi:hypothetical protein
MRIGFRVLFAPGHRSEGKDADLNIGVAKWTVLHLSNSFQHDWFCIAVPTSLQFDTKE